MILKTGNLTVKSNIFNWFNYFLFYLYLKRIKELLISCNLNIFIKIKNSIIQKLELCYFLIKILMIC